MTYRLQRSDHQGVVQRAFGGRVASWSAWRTVGTWTEEKEGLEAFQKASGRGLSRWRLMHGKDVVKKSL
jgi:hypothetical protein